MNKFEPFKFTKVVLSFFHSSVVLLNEEGLLFRQKKIMSGVQAQERHLKTVVLFSSRNLKTVVLDRASNEACDFPEQTVLTYEKLACLVILAHL